jgi:hypothetical protein
MLRDYFTFPLDIMVKIWMLPLASQKMAALQRGRLNGFHSPTHSYHSPLSCGEEGSEADSSVIASRRKPAL